MKILRLLLCFLLTGCATARGIDERVDFDPAGQTTVYRDQYVRKSALEVYIEPAERASYAPKVLFLPFRVTQEMDNPTMAGYSAARSIWQTWSGMRLFPTMEFTGDDVPFRRDRAVILARQRGADMVVGGFVTYLYAGGTAGDTQIAIQIEGIDATSGQTVWSMAQSAMVPASVKKDYFLFAVKHQMPSDPLMACIREIGADMGKKVQAWMAGAVSVESAPGELVERVDRGVHNAVFPNRLAIPPARPMHTDSQPQGGL